MYRRPMGRDDDAVARLWERYQGSEDAEAFGRLMEHYAPLVRIVAVKLKRRTPVLYADPLEELISDGTIGLIFEIHKRKYSGPWWRNLLIMQLRKWIRRAVLSRRWGGLRNVERLNAIQRARLRLLHRLEKLPTRQELLDELGIVNPNIQVGEKRRGRPKLDPLRDPQMALASDGAALAMEFHPAHDEPDAGLLTGELFKLLADGLDEEDRSVLRLALDGKSTAEIGRTLGIPNAFERVNGVLWQLRCREDLAYYLGVEPWRGEAPRRTGRHLQAITAAPPARRIG